MAGPANAVEQVETIQDVVRQLMQACLDHHRLGWVSIATSQLEEGEVFEIRARFGWGSKRPGDDRWPYVKRVKRNGDGRHLIVPRGQILG